MWDWIKNIGTGIGNIFSGRTWSGEDPEAIKNEANKAIEEAIKDTSAKYDSMLSQIQNQNQNKSTTLLLIGGVGLAIASMFFFGGKRR